MMKSLGWIKIGLIVLAFILLVLIFLFKSNNLIAPEIQKDLLVRNLSWQTGFDKQIPYKKGDLLEYVLFLDSLNLKTIALDIDKIKNGVSIKNIQIDDKDISEKDLQNLNIKGPSILKITGEAKGNSIITGETNLEDIGINVINNNEDQVAQDDVLSPDNKVEIFPDPTNVTLKNASFNSNINNLLEITGNNLSSVDYINIGGKSIKGVLNNDILYVSLSKNTFDSGEYFIFFQLKNGKLFTLNDKMYFEFSSEEINIANLTPKELKNDQDRYIVLQGNGFSKIISVQLNNNVILKSVQFKIINDNVTSIIIPKDLPEGEYYFNIMDTKKIYELTKMKFKITK